MEKLLTLTVPGGDGEVTIEGPQGIITGGLESSRGGSVVSNIIELLLFGIVVVALVMIIYSGIQYIMAQGDKTKLQAARNRLIYAIIGLTLAFLSFAIINIVSSMFGVSYF